MSERDELIDQLRYRPVATTAAQMRKAADLLERDGARIAELEAEIARLCAEVERLTAEQDAVSAAIGTNEYMDPPDGGNVSLAEQVRRMRDALLARAEAWERAAQGEHPSPCTLGPLCPYCEIDRLQARVEAAERAAMERGK